MESISLREVLQRAACRIGCHEDSVWGDLDSAAAGLTRLLLECLAESEVDRRAEPACTSAARAEATIATVTGLERLN